MKTGLTHNEYHLLVRILDDLIDSVSENENHLFPSLIDAISELIETHADKHVPELAEI